MGLNTLRARVLAACASVFVSLACASSQLDSGPDHPASPQAATAPLPPVGGELSEAESVAPVATPADGAAATHEHQGSPEGHRTEPASDASQPTGTGGSSEGQHHSHANTASSAPAAHEHRQAGSTSEAAAQKWTCPMHPEVIQSEPGKCPKCGMTLVPVEPPKQTH